MTEGAAFGLLKLCSGVAAGPKQATQATQATVKPTTPAHHSDPRYAFATCLLAVARAAAAGGGASPATPIQHTSSYTFTQAGMLIWGFRGTQGWSTRRSRRPGRGRSGQTCTPRRRKTCRSL